MQRLDEITAAAEMDSCVGGPLVIHARKWHHRRRCFSTWSAPGTKPTSSPASYDSCWLHP